MSAFVSLPFFESGRVALTAANRHAGPDGLVAPPAIGEDIFAAESNKNPTPSVGFECVPLDVMKTCSDVPHWCKGQYCPWQQCGNHTWAWWRQSALRCLQVAAHPAIPALIRACCNGWSDLVFILARFQKVFRILAMDPWRAVFMDIAFTSIRVSYALPASAAVAAVVET